MTPSDELEDVVTALQASTAETPRDTPFTVAVVEGPDQRVETTLHVLNPVRVLIGQSASCSLRLTDRAVSRRHAALQIDEGGVRVTDLGSTNGTFVDDVRVHEAIARDGSYLRVGATLLRVERAQGAQEIPLSTAAGFGRLLGASVAMRRLYPLCSRLAASHVPVVLEGETGTGKEVLAESLHEASPRADGPYIIFDCTAVPPSLLESELFGHEKGAFTGATGTRKGVFEQAHGGTLFIDEIGDLDIALQPKLLRAIERAEIRRIGSQQLQRVDVRILSATRRNLDFEVQCGRFRDDLFHRLTVARIELPPLRERKGDVAFLARAFWRDLGGVGAPPENVLARWRDDPWPGNVRELRNAVARLLALGDLAPPKRLPSASIAPPPGDSFLSETLSQRLPLPMARRKVVEEFERRYVEQVLADHGGNVGKAAAASGIARRYFQMIRVRSGG